MEQKRVVDFLQKGKQNAIPAKQLASAMGFKSTRQLRLAIELERRSGTVILSTQDPVRGGYYLPANQEELDSYIAEMEARARTTLEILRSAKRFRKLHTPGQMYMIECSDGGKHNAEK